MKRIPDRTVLQWDNQWGSPHKRALFVSDGPDSTTSGSDILETAVVRLQQDIADYRAELKYNRTQTPAVSTRPPKRRCLCRRQIFREVELGAISAGV